MKTINKVFLILFVSLAASTLFAQSDLSFGYRRAETAINTFVQKVKGAGTLTTAALQAGDGGCVTTSRINKTSFLVRKIRVSGQKQWERRLKFPTIQPFNPFASIAGIAQTTDGGFVLLGQLGVDYPPFEEATEATLVKLRPKGTVAWQKSFKLSGVSGQSFSSRFSSVIATPDGGVIAIGAITEDRVFLADLELGFL